MKTYETYLEYSSSLEYEMVALGGGALSQRQLLVFGSSARRCVYAPQRSIAYDKAGFALRSGLAIQFKLNRVK
ncbi:hypothetical protein [Helicobacter sp. 11S02596-1]|uniref:hypothetical protein n=1 Tax=Helicobacter sp. 11S02596-1 TaxID=1476194 RepID=UPI000BA4E88E|nr:hypothetical protein [Helicobacter sp. 11S02596-1]PAF41026.1 hypothetical protein BJI48_09210 [Helicobacter sp. 11S02596-1]